MQTFLPYPDFKKSAEVLDYRRLGKQRVEAMQIYNILTYRTKKLGWRNHPAVKMWHDSDYGLAFYIKAMIQEWKARGYKNTMVWPPICDDLILCWPSGFPSWLGDEKFHASHRSNLLRKDPTYYGKFGWKEPPDLPYVWPT